MTEESKRIREEFVEMINQNPSNISQYNWIDITKGFDNETMAYIICRIKDEDVAREVIKCILDAWNYAIGHKDPICKATDPDTFRKDVYKYRPPHTLDYTLNQILKSRKIFVDMHSFKGKNSIDSSKDIVQNDERLLELEAENKRLSEKKEQLVIENRDRKKKIETLMMQHESQRLKIEGLEQENAKKLLLINQLKSEIETLKAALLENRQYARQDPNTEASESGVTEWIACFDGFLHSSLNPQAIANALHSITHTYFSKNEKAYWWVFYTVLTEIHWIPKKDYKLALQWANLHFNCGWDWRKDHQFRFSDINDKIKAAPSSKWNKALTGNVIGDYYGELAKNMKKTFVFVVNGGKLRDNDKYIIPGSPLINTGR